MSPEGSPAEILRRKILALPGIIEKAHRVSPHAYYVGGREIAHFHGPHQIDIHLTQVAQAEALAR
ncbi:MAG: luciferase family protein, partial [Candidatus Methylomirabilales bacterium]